jgi:hypothetical protein
VDGRRRPVDPSPERLDSLIDVSQHETSVTVGAP